MIERNTSAKQAVAFLYQEFNDIDIYVEDSAPGFKKIYLEILKRVFLNKYNIDQIIPIGKRDEVILACQQQQNFTTDRKRLFIIDGDLYLLHNNFSHSLNGLYVLPKYSIENFLIDKKSLVKIFYEHHLDDDAESVESKLSFEVWISRNESILFDLFVEYAIIHYFKLGIITVKYKVSKLCSSNEGIIDPIKVNNRINTLRKEVIKRYGMCNYYRIRTLILKNSANTNNKLLTYISAKDYLLPLLHTRATQVCGTHCNSQILNVQLSMHSDISALLDMHSFVF